MGGFEALDWVAVAGYFGLMLVIVWWVVLQKQRTSTDYFLAGRHMPWFVLGPQSLPQISAPNILSDWPVKARPAVWVWPTGNCTPGLW